jgi:glycosyltransferase involved in cell wall biosynthesis
MASLSVALATFNEENNLEQCLESVKDLADEIVIVDGSSTDKTVEIARRFGARVTIKDNPPIFHINKQKALDLASKEWILQLDADERVSPELKEEIKKVISMPEKELEIYQNNLPDQKLFLRHQSLIEKRDRATSSEGPFVAFFIPRLNYFLGKYLKHGGVYPDGVIRLLKKGKARFPCKDVHEQIAVNGRVGWLQNPLYHKDSPTFKRYLQRNSRYTDLIAAQMKNDNIGTNPINYINYLFLKPIRWLLLTQIRHKGILDGMQGFIFSFFSSLRFPIAYLKYLKIRKSK